MYFEHAFHHFILHYFNVYCTYDYTPCMFLAACASVHEGLWELSDNMVPYYERFPIIDSVAMETGVLGMHVEFV